MLLPTAAPPAPPRRERLARLERPLLLAGLALVTTHLLDLSVSGPATSPWALLVIAGLAVAWAVAHPRLIRPTRIALAVPAGLLATGFGIVSHGLHAVHLGPDRYDVTGLLFIAGGAALLGSAVAAAAAPRGTRRSLRALRVPAWAGGAVAGLLLLIPLGGSLMITHAPRWPIHERTLGVAHEEVRIPAGGGRELAAWWVPPRNGVGVLLIHGSGGSRARVAAHARMLARHGYGVLALDLPGNGESEGHSNGLGDTAQPAVTRALDYLAARPGVERIAGYGVSMGGEILLEAAARDPRLRAVVSDGAARPEDAAEALPQHGLGDLVSRTLAHAARALAGTRAAPSLTPLVPRIAPRPVLLVATTGDPQEIPTNRVYARAAGPTTRLWEIRGIGHIAGVRRRLPAYERRTTGFLDRALGVRGRDAG